MKPTSHLPRIIRKRGNWGRIPQLRLLLEHVRAKHAACYHDAVVSLLEAEGWFTKREYGVTFPSGRKGRVDVVAMKPGTGPWNPDLWLALELDNRSPRRKSIIKLEQFPEAYWITGILLRDPH